MCEGLVIVEGRCELSFYGLGWLFAVLCELFIVSLSKHFEKPCITEQKMLAKV